MVDLTTGENCVTVRWVYVQQSVDWPEGLLVSKRGGGEQRTECQVVRYAIVAGIVGTPPPCYLAE